MAGEIGRKEIEAVAKDMIAIQVEASDAAKAKMAGMVRELFPDVAAAIDELEDLRMCNGLTAILLGGSEALLAAKRLELEARRLTAPTLPDPSREPSDADLAMTMEEWARYDQHIEEMPRAWDRIFRAKTFKDLAKVAAKPPKKALTSARHGTAFRVAVQYQYWDIQRGNQYGDAQCGKATA